MSKRWMSSGFLRAAPTGEVSAEKGVVEGVSVCTVGEAKGHGVHLDREFIGRVAELGNEKKQGVKARFGHPNMCSTALGTFLGRFKNFSVDGDQVRADLFLSNEAKETPHGDLYGYVCGMAANEPDMFGTSIVFTPGRTYRRDEDTGEKVYGGEYGDDKDRKLSDEVYVEIETLHACDAVDNPAANDGLFSAFSQETIAGQISEFLDLHPHVWGAIQDNPSIVEALGRYGDKVDEFIESYRAYREQNGGSEMTDERTNSEQLEESSVEEPEASATPETQTEELEATAEPTAESEATEEPNDAEFSEEGETPESPEELAQTETPAEEADEEVEPDALSREEFTEIADAFGAEIAATVMRDGGDFGTAQGIYAEQMRAENERLRERVAELEAGNVGSAAKVVEPKVKKPLFRTGQ